MAELLAYFEPGDPPKQRLRLVINWLWIGTAPDTGELLSSYEIGIFLGEEPLFNSPVYERERGPDLELGKGFFFAESEGCQILSDLHEVLDSGRRVEIEDAIEPAIRLVIGSDILSGDNAPNGDEAPEFFEVLVIVQAGGPWSGRIYGMSGPAVWMDVERADLDEFCRQLRQEALMLRQNELRKAEVSTT